MMKEKDKIHFFDTSGLSVTENIRQRCNAEYVQKALEKRLPDEHFRVTSVSINETGRYEAKVNWLVKLLWNNGKVEGLPAYCEVLIEHCTGQETENIIVWSPLAWNDRFAGTAGGGTCTGGVSQITQPNNGQRGWTVPFAVINGFTAATCDAGNEKYGSNWAVGENGKLVFERIENWRANATHYMTVFGKAVAEILHERPVKYAYMNGGSGGGRQSMVEAQEFPEDYDGIWASCPAINWNKFLITGFWPMAVANEYKAPLKYHKLTYFAKAVQESVGGAEAYYNLPERVEFDPFSLVGQKTKQGVITKEDAKVIQEMWDGPHRSNGERLWYGFRPGSIHWCTGLPIFSISFIFPFMKAHPFNLCKIYARWVLDDTKANFEKIDKKTFEELFDKSLSVFPKVAADNANLSAFAACGGKLMIDHGLDDPLIPVDGTIDYYERMKAIMGADEVNKFCRLYLGPGDNHGNCIGNGPGISESDGMRAMMNWVENGVAPGTIRVVRLDRKTGEMISEGTREPA